MNYWKNASQQKLPFTIDPRLLYRGYTANTLQNGLCVMSQFFFNGVLGKLITGGADRPLGPGESCLIEGGSKERQTNVVAVGFVRCARLKAADAHNILGPLQAAIDHAFTRKVLSSVELFSSLDTRQMTEVITRMAHKKLDKGELVSDFWYVTTPDGRPLQQGEGGTGPASKTGRGNLVYHDYNVTSWGAPEAPFDAAIFDVPAACRATEKRCAFP